MKSIFANLNVFGNGLININQIQRILCVGSAEVKLVLLVSNTRYVMIAQNNTADLNVICEEK